MNCFTSLQLDTPVAVIAALLAALLAMRIWVWRGQRFPGREAFGWANLAMMWWLFAAGMELASPALACKLFWSRAAWPGIALLPTAWALFFYDYAIGNAQGPHRPGARLDRRRLRRLALLFTGPLLIGAMAFADGWHHAFYGIGTRLVMVDGHLSGVYQHGPLFYVAMVYTYLWLMASFGIGLLAISRSSGAFRGFFLLIMGMTAAPIAANLAYVIGGFTLFGFDPTPFLFSVVIAVLGWLALNNQMMDINGIARHILFYASSDPILITDTEAVLVGCNPEARRLFGDALPALGSPLADASGFGPVLESLHGPGAAHGIAPILRDNRAFDPRLQPIVSPLAPGRPSLGWLLTLVDITEQQRVATSLRLAADRAREASKAKSQFVSTVSHELRTPLTSIKGALALLDSPTFADLRPDAKRILKIAISNSDRLHALIDDLLDLNRMEAGAMTFQRTPLDLAALLSEACEANESYGSSFSVAMRRLPVEAPVMVSADRGRLMQVLANILSNAFKFSRTGGTVTVGLERDGQIARISIRDEGIGIPQGASEKVFGVFSQVDASDVRRVSGSGLGMSIARRIVEMHEGHIDYRSVLGEGTTFFVELPLLETA